MDKFFGSLLIILDVVRSPFGAKQVDRLGEEVVVNEANEDGEHGR
jgi:hypothetical protein